MLIHDNPYEIRTVTSDDADAILDVYRQCEDFLALGPEPVASMSMVLKDIKASQREGRDYCGIYHSNGGMVGIIDFKTDNYDGDPRVAFIALLMIDRPFRRQDTGTRVVNMVEREIRTTYNVKTILSAVQVNNPDAQRFWYNNGYNIVGGPELQPDKTIVLHLRKDLSKV